MEVMEAITGRRSIRKYKTDPVPDEALKTVLEAARLAPSWANTQCWRIIVVRDNETKWKLSEILISNRPGRPNPATEAMKNAPIVIAACAERGVSGFYKDEAGQLLPSTDKGDYWYMFDVALAMQNMVLAAHSLGLGTVHVGLFDAPAAAKILGVPDNAAIVELVPLGWPDEAPLARPRKEISEFIFSEKYQVK